MTVLSGVPFVVVFVAIMSVIFKTNRRGQSSPSPKERPPRRGGGLPRLVAVK